MGITIIQKSTPRTRKLNPKLALVLAGGAVTGGAFNLGGLAALDDLLVNRKVVDFDIYVGLSAGALLAAPLAAGVPPSELIETLDGHGDLGEFRLRDFYRPNLGEIFSKPIDFITDLATFVPAAIAEMLTKSPTTWQRLQEPLRACAEAPGAESLQLLVTELERGLQTTRSFPFLLNYLPSGAFDNRGLESFLRRGFATRGITNNFRSLFRERGKELYVVAVNLDTAERVVFGHDEDSALTISESVQASTALPGFYKPARIKGIDYIDGGVRRTVNIDVAIEHGADLVIAYNPFRPFNNERLAGATRGQHGSALADHGLFAVVNQVFRSLLHSRLHIGLNQYRDDPSFQGDIILIEPTDSDDTFFQMFPLDFWARRKAAEHGYLSVAGSIQAHYDTIETILRRYGIQMNPAPTHEGIERIREGLPARTAALG
jgi:predicted acylesterase/phospholipase RssA